jgi:hypothetical protein
MKKPALDYDLLISLAEKIDSVITDLFVFGTLVTSGKRDHVARR